jgi:hypothetical protein
MRFAFNCPQASQGHGSDGALYLVDYGAVRDNGVGGEGESEFVDPEDASLVQVPGTGVIWKITRTDS